MKNLIIILSLFSLISCDSGDTKIIKSKSGITLSSNRLAALEKPMASFQISPKLRSLERDKQMSVLQNIEMKLYKVGFNNPNDLNLDWKESAEKADLLLKNESTYEYLKEIQQAAAQHVLLQTNILEDISPEAQKEVTKNILLMSQAGSSSVSVVHYVFKKYGNYLDANLKKDVAKSVLKVYNENVSAVKLSKEEKESMAKVNLYLLKRMEYLENANSEAVRELSLLQ